MSLTVSNQFTDPDVGEFSLGTLSKETALQTGVSTGTVEDIDVLPYTLPTPLDWNAIAQDFCTIDFVFPGLTAGGLGMLAAPGGTGKSYMLLALASSIAMGKPLLPDWPECKPTKVLVFFAEDPPDIVHNRLRHLLQSPWVGEPKYQQLLKENLVVRSLVGEDCIVAHQPKFEDKWYRTQFSTAVEEEATACQARLIMFDPLRQSHQMDENDSGEMTDLLKLMHGIAFRSKAAILFAHHTNKNSSFQGAGDAQQAARGSSAITDNIRWQGNMVLMSEEEATKYNILEDDRKGYVRLVLSKSNYTQARGDLWFKRGAGGILLPETLTEVGKPKQELDFGTSTKTSQKSSGYAISISPPIDAVPHYKIANSDV